MNLEDVEKNVEVRRITHKGISVWPVLKSYLIDIAGERKVIKEINSSYLKILLGNFLGDIWSLRKIGRSKYWVFSTSQTRFHINEDSFDRITTSLLKYLDGYLLFENPIPKGRTPQKKLQKGEHYIGMSWIFLMQFLILKLSKRPKIENLDVLESYLNKDLSKMEGIYQRIQAGQKICSLLFKLFRPKVIFVVCYYSNFGLVQAAKKRNIPVIELQHGLVTDGHRAYHFHRPQPADFLPDYFLSYGTYSSNIVAKGKVFEPNRILDYGYPFLEEVERRLTISKELESLKEEFDKTICITGQLEVTDKPLLDMISNVCDDFPRYCFIFKPRHFNEQTSFPSKPNFIRNGVINTYELLKYCDYHLTVYSTCALECLALGTPNISVDIKGYYTQYLKKMLGGNPYNSVANSEKKLREILGGVKDRPYDKTAVKKSVSHIFSPQIDTEDFFNFFNKVSK